MSQGSAETNTGLVTLIDPPLIVSELDKQTKTFSVGLEESATVNEVETPNSLVFPVSDVRMRLPEFGRAKLEKSAIKPGVGFTVQDNKKLINKK